MMDIALSVAQLAFPANSILALAFPVYLVFFIVRKIISHKRGIVGPSWPSLLLYLAVFLITISIFISNALAFNVKARQSEAKVNLHSIQVYLKAYYSETGTWAGAGGGKVFETIDWSPQGSSRYSYYCGNDVIKSDKLDFDLSPSDPKWPFFVKPYVTEEGYQCLAIGDIDGDEFLDVWKITQADPEAWLAYNDVEDEIRKPGWEKTSILGPILMLLLDILLIASLLKDARKYRQAKKLLKIG